MERILPISSVSHTVPSILTAFKQAIRSPFAWPGGYTIALYTMDGERICNSCAREQWPEICSDTIDGYGMWQAGHTEVYWEGPPQHCVQCNKPQDSEYGDPDADKTKLHHLATRIIESYGILMNCDGCHDGLPAFTSMQAHELMTIIASFNTQAIEALDPKYPD